MCQDVSGELVPGHPETCHLADDRLGDFADEVRPMQKVVTLNGTRTLPRNFPGGGQPMYFKIASAGINVM